MSETPKILCIGAVLWDVIGQTERHMKAGYDCPGRITRRLGGVALNAAVALRGHGVRPVLLSAVGQDAEGAALIAECEAYGLDCTMLTRPADLPTDHYMAIEAAGVLLGAIADARSLERAGDSILTPLRDGRLGSAAAPWAGAVVLDGNLTEDLLGVIATDPCFAAADLRAAPASPGKAGRLAPLFGHPGLTLYVNRIEAGLILGRDFDGAPEAAAALHGASGARVLVTDGAAPAAYHGSEGALQATPPVVDVVHITGAGDAFLSAHVSAELSGADAEAALHAALAGAAAHVSGAKGLP